VIRIASFFDLLTFSSYCSTAIIFSVLSFCGSWAMFNTFYRGIPIYIRRLRRNIVYTLGNILGIRDSKRHVILAALGFSVYCIDVVFIQKRIKISVIALLFLSLYVIFSIKKFVLQAFIPSAILWIYFKKLNQFQVHCIEDFDNAFDCIDFIHRLLLCF